MQTKERRNVELKSIITHNLGDGVQPIMEWVKLSMGPCKAFFLQVQLKFVSHLMLIMALLVLGIRIM